MSFRRNKHAARSEKFVELSRLDPLENRTMLSTVTVNAGTTIGPVNTQMLGVNLATWDGLLTNATAKTDSQAAGLDAFRLPGGSTADVYHWYIQNGGSSVNGSASIVDMANFIASQNATGSSVVTVNYGTGSPEEGAAELAYLNGVPSAALDNISLNVAGEGSTWTTTPQVSVSSLTRSGTVATATVASTANMVTGESVTISGATPSGYNGAKTITVTSPTTFTFTASSNLATPATGSIKASGSLWLQGGVTESGQTSPSWQTAGFWATLRTQSPIAGNPDGLNFLRIGRTQPFAFHYWEMGNEEYGSWETDDHNKSGDTLPSPGNVHGIHNPTEYIAFSKEFATFSAQIDPTISIGISTQSTNTGDFSNWLSNASAANPQGTNGIFPQAVLQGFTPGFLSDHIYPQSPGGESDSGLLNSGTTLNGSSTGTNGISTTNTYDLTQRATIYRNLMNFYFGSTASANITLLGTEFNSVSSSPGKQMNSVTNELFLDNSVGLMLDSGPTGYQGLWTWDLHNGAAGGSNASTLYGWRTTGDYGILGNGGNPLGAVVGTPPNTTIVVSTAGSEAQNEELPDYFAELLASKIVQAGGTVVQASSDDPNLLSYAVKEANGDLELLVINLSNAGLNINGTGPTSSGAYPSITGTFNIAGFTPSTSAQLWQYGSVEDTEQKGSNTQIGLTNSSPTLSLNGSSFAMAFPNYSVSVLDLTPAVAVPPPAVSNVVVSGSAWSSSFMSALLALNANNVGGYSIPVGSSAQLNALPWSNINQISITFSQNVSDNASGGLEGALQLFGVNVPTYAFSGFVYNSSTDTATWTLSAPIVNDKLEIDLGDTVVNASNENLAGGWTDGVSSYPSGTGGTAANFTFSFNVLTGDVNHSNGVNAIDLNLVQNQIGQTPASGSYNLFADLNGSGGVNAIDLNLVQNKIGQTLPAGSPILPGGTLIAKATLLSAPASLGNLSSSKVSPLFSTNTINLDSFSQMLNPKDRVELL
jgi:hypothetical protein